MTCYDAFVDAVTDLATLLVGLRAATTASPRRAGDLGRRLGRRDGRRPVGRARRRLQPTLHDVRRVRSVDADAQPRHPSSLPPPATTTATSFLVVPRVVTFRPTQATNNESILTSIPPRSSASVTTQHAATTNHPSRPSLTHAPTTSRRARHRPRRHTHRCPCPPRLYNRICRSKRGGSGTFAGSLGNGLDCLEGDSVVTARRPGTAPSRSSYAAFSRGPRRLYLGLLNVARRRRPLSGEY